MKNKYDSFKQYFNVFNLKDRPYVEYLDLNGAGGNVIEIGPIFSNALRKAGYKEEGNYFGYEKYDLMKKAMNNNFSYDFIMSLALSMLESNAEIESNFIDEQNKNNPDNEDEDVFLVIKKNKKNNENIYGRGELHYLNIAHEKSESIHEIIKNNYSEIFKKDKMNFNILEHYLLSEKNNEYCLLLQYLYINNEPEEYKTLLESSHFNYNIIDNVSKSSINTYLHTNLLKYKCGMINSPQEMINDSINFIDQKCNELYNKMTKTHIDNLLEIINEFIEVLKYKNEEQLAEKFITTLILSIQEKNSDINSVINKEYDPDVYITKLEKEFLVATISNNIIEKNEVKKIKKL